ncbi:MAG: helix-turn-helix transcriptional regulator [Clostridia bacterium]|nr:helix-turn-helix transcriptional regulator [Clostridia bacterium]
MDNIIKRYNTLDNSIFFHHTVSGVSENDRIYGPESHAQFEILYLLSDGIEYVIEGEHYNVNRGDAIVVLPHEIHTIIRKGGYNYERLVIVFDVDSLYNLVSDKSEILELFTEKVKGKRVIPKSVIDASPLKDVFSSIMNDVLPDKYCGFSFASKIFNLAIELDKLLSSTTVELLTPTSVDPLTIQAIKYIEKHLTDELNLSEIAKCLFVSKSTLCHKFKSNMNMTVNQYYTTKKIKLAEELIKNGVTANEACFRVGYTSYLTFYYNYKRIIGQPPSQTKK